MIDLEKRVALLELKQKCNYTRVIIVTKKTEDMSVYLIHLYLPEATEPQINSWAFPPDVDTFKIALNRVTLSLEHLKIGDHVEFICRENPGFNFPFFTIWKIDDWTIENLENQLTAEIQKRLENVRNNSNCRHTPEEEN